MLWLLLEGIIAGQVVLYFKTFFAVVFCLCGLGIYLLRDRS